MEEIKKEAVSATAKTKSTKTDSKQLKRLIKRGIPLYLMILAPVIWYVIFCYVPMYGLTIAFKKYNVYIGYSSPWLTDAYGNFNLFGHFKEFLKDPYFWQVMKNTFVLGFFNTLVCFPAPIILALAFNELRSAKFKKIMQTLSYLPYFVSTVAIVGIITTMISLEGVINNVINALGGDSINFIAEKGWFVPIYVIMNLWRSIGWGTIIYIASMASIDTALYEAAELDGAGRFTKIWHVTLPFIKPTIIVQLILAIPGIVSADFEAVLLLQRDQNLAVSDIVSTYIYRRGPGSVSGIARYDYSTAIGLVFSIFSLFIVMLANWIARKASETSLF